MTLETKTQSKTGMPEKTSERARYVELARQGLRNGDRCQRERCWVRGSTKATQPPQNEIWTASRLRRVPRAWCRVRSRGRSRTRSGCARAAGPPASPDTGLAHRPVFSRC